MKTILFATLASVLALSAPVQAQQAEGGRKISTTLSGAVEVPGPGDADGTGAFEAQVNPGQGQVCYKLTTAAIDAVTMLHIHRGAAGASGPVAVNLTLPASGSSETCAAVTRELAMELIQKPEAFYVNVHNASLPGGAVRGQLAKGS